MRKVSTPQIRRRHSIAKYLATVALFAGLLSLDGIGSLVEQSPEVAAISVRARVGHHEPAEVREVRGERLQLSATAPDSWKAGTRLREIQVAEPGKGITAPRAVDPASVVVRSGDFILKEGTDYLLEHTWGSLGLGPSTKLTADTWVTVDYRYSLRRLDSLIRLASGEEIIRQGESHLTVPTAPALASGETRLANIFVDYFDDGRQPDVYPIFETAAQAKTNTTSGRIPKTMAKLAAGLPVKIVCWGDSVTVGGDSSSLEHRYSAVFARRMQNTFPRSQVTVATIAVGGSASSQWVYPSKYRYKTMPSEIPNVNWDRVFTEKPDLVTIEFVNDAGAPVERYEPTYCDILERLQKTGTEVILITPHFTMPSLMKFHDLREPDSRAYVKFLLAFASEHELAVADASSRWAHLWKEGIPYVTLIRNGINHPDDRGHLIFADELMACFAESPAAK